MSKFDPANINLHGLHLIEASAGTGKTYTLTTLYLRLLLEANLNPSRILVVTFTKAATEALRERVRSRILEALVYLEQHQDSPKSAPDHTLEAIRVAATQAKTILVEALSRMDEAAIYTIHSFCQRMLLQDYAFESGSSFAAELISDDSQLRNIATADVWRRRVANISMEQAQWLRTNWTDPQELLGDIAPILNQDTIKFLPAIDIPTSDPNPDPVMAKLNKLRSTWQDQKLEIIQILETSPALNRRSYTKSVVAKAVAAMDIFANTTDLPTALAPGCERFSSRLLTAQTKSKANPPQHTFFDLCGELEQELPTFSCQRKAIWYQQAYHQVKQALATSKQKLDVLAFDDLLEHLDVALHSDTIGDSRALAAAIRAHFPVVLIDEFQDTDPKQYRIFSQIYSNQPKCGLFLIGDPKQAIYAFRGADIFTYMAARKIAIQTRGAHNLDINWRSSTRLVTAVNTIFSNIPTPFIYDTIQFTPARPNPKADNNPLLINSQEPIPLQIWLLTPPPSASATTNKLFTKDAIPSAAKACAEYIAQLLHLASRNQAVLGKRPVLSKDIAILVHSHREGYTMQQALRACNVNSVTLSQDNIFCTEQALQFMLVLAAIAKPNAEGLIRTALATDILGWQAQALDNLFHDETAWEVILNKFQSYHDLWVNNSFTVLFQKILIAEQITSRLLQNPDGERWLTNLLQLGELMQQAATEYADPDSLLRWLNTQIFNSNQEGYKEANEDRQLRLESDEGLVTIITMHKSKGLEYPIVFIPFPWSLKDRRMDTDKPVLFHDAANNYIPCLDFGTTAQQSNRELHKQEQIAEQIRLFYVALTRASHLCILCWGLINQAASSAPALLLHPDPKDSLTSRLNIIPDLSGLKDELSNLAALVPGCIKICAPPTVDTTYLVAPTATHSTNLQAAKFTAHINRNWSVSSYSSLIRGDDSGRPDHDRQLAPSPIPEADIVPDPTFAFPAGAESGLFLHSILERLDFSKADNGVLTSAIQAQLANYASLNRAPSDSDISWKDVATTIITNCLNTPLNMEVDDGTAMRLRDISWNNRLSELEFHYPLAQLSPQSLHNTLSAFPAYRDSAKNLQFTTCNGLMHGFIDLVFRSGSRYYIADYKSNRLGMQLADYDQDGMHQAIQEHRYDLQYLVYSVAVHRFLKQRLPQYDFEQHFGGVYYLFLRGMRPQYGSKYGVYFDRPTWEVIARLDKLFGTQYKLG
ncbi:hypothetical protein TI04_02715 [Achromatium sp. WMS2]|nr:hypothetical protein TI04_02715 [Achromatium sp. WMS2]